MKKIISIVMTTLLFVTMFSTMSFAASMTPIKQVSITDVDTPYNTKQQLDTTVKISDDSYSYFVESKWTQMSGDLYKLTIKTRTYRDYVYDANTKATINGNEAQILEIKEENRYMTFSYTFPKQESATGPINSSSLTHPITIMYLSNGRISPNPIRAPHRKNTTVQIIPDEGYRVKDVLVDGESVGAVTEYTFKKVTESHKIKAYFEPIPGYIPQEKEEIESGEISGDVVIEEVTYNFNDVTKNDWYYDAVQYVCKNKIFSGTSENTFEPDAVMTRAMIAKVLYNHAKENGLIKTLNYGNNNFEDVSSNEWYAVAVEWAVANQITNGTTETTYSPNENLTREQLVTLLYRYVQANEVSVSIDTNILSYDDAFDISEYAIEAFQWACGSGIINGKTESTLAPQDLVTRAEVAMIMMRFDTFWNRLATFDV